jgi:[histone H3]-trimethyl-L-lysine9/36 demethylase
MEQQDVKICPTFRPTRLQFERPFIDYVGDVFRRHPDIPMFKVGSRLL